VGGSQVADYYEIRYVLGRREWARTEWPALLVWVAPPILILLGILAATIYASAWWALTLPIWFILGGAKATGILWFLLRGSRFLLLVDEDGTVFVGENGSEPQYCHWVGFVDEGETLLLWGADGRYRLIIPKRVLTKADYSALRSRMGIDVEKLQAGQEARIRTK
jgi:hypothetical protein